MEPCCRFGILKRKYHINAAVQEKAVNAQADRPFRIAVLVIFVMGVGPALAEGPSTSFPWTEPKAEVLPTGDLRWTPEPFVYEPGQTVRYIDYERGDDAGPGTREKPWKHHPWDPHAEARAAAATGVDTYVFRRGVMYRGSLTVDTSGEPGRPIRLTSDPSWGEGEALVVGSQRLSGWKQGADHPDIPDADRVWWVDLDFAPRNLWTIGEDGQIARIPLARTPNWRVSDPDDVKSEWFHFNNPGRREVWGMKTKLQGAERPMGVDTENLTRDAEYYEGALIWSEYGWVMGTPYPSRVAKFDPEKKALVFGGQWGRSIGKYHYPRYVRYYLEDKPHYLDDSASGEFWLDKRGDGGRLYLRLPGDADPRTTHVEAARRIHLIDSRGMSHVHISGLGFRFTNVLFDLTLVPLNRPDVDPACIRLLGSGRDLVVANCSFRHVHMPILLKAAGKSTIDRVVVRDNEISHTDHGGLVLHDGTEWGAEFPEGRLLDVKVLRNRLGEIGRRPSRYGQGHAIEIRFAETLEVAGNHLDRLYGSGIFVFGGKDQVAKVDRPLTRILIHHNKVVDSMLNNNDWGGIETWQGGPAYVFNNVSGNPGGFKLWGHRIHDKRPANSRFGHAYYMDGGFKQYYFNNIAWGKSNDPFDRLGNTSAFQEIHGYACSIFNNTVYNFVIGSRRQAPEAGRNKYMGNIWHGIGHMVFRHADPKDLAADPNAADAGARPSNFRHRSNVYANNVFYKLPGMVAVFEPSGRWHGTLESFRRALTMRGSIGEAGEAVERSPLRDPAAHDFRPTEAARDRGVRAFVPWGLYAPVAEWDFYHAGDDPTLILDDHFYLAPYYVGRAEYHKNPTYPLQTVNMRPECFVEGPLEDWVRGALELNGKDQYCVLRHASLAAGPAQEEPPEIKNKPHEKIAFEVPEAVTPGRRLEVKVRLKDVEPGMKIKADLHWQRGNRQFGGMNAWGGEGHTVRGEGPYVFKYTPQDKPNLGYFIVTAYTTPTGEWKDRVDLAQWGIPPKNAAPAEGYRNAVVRDSNFLVEAYFRTDPGHTGGIVLEKLDRAGYSLRVNVRGGLVFRVAGQGESGRAESESTINDGKWHHVIAEADRSARLLAIYVDGRLDARSAGVGSVSIDNTADLYVGGSPEGGHLAGAIEFMRIALGTLADAKTTIDELHAWQFDGPFLRDFTGRAPTGPRDAGALEAVR